MIEEPLERLTDEIIDKLDECREERKSLQQQCAILSEALTKEQWVNIDMLLVLEAIIEFDNENVLVAEDKSAGSEEDKALNKILVTAAAAIKKARS